MVRFNLAQWESFTRDYNKSRKLATNNVDIIITRCKIAPTERQKSLKMLIPTGELKLLFNSKTVNGSKRIEVSRMSNWAIIISKDATVADEYAMEEFQNWFEKSTGIHLPLHTDKKQADGHIYIGRASTLDHSEIDDEGFSVIVEHNRIIITGGGTRGALYGVYQFLEDSLGIRFLTDDHTHVPDSSNLEIPFGNYTYCPPFSFRWSFYRENSENPEFAARRRVNTVTPAEKLGGNVPQQLINHSFHQLVPFSKYGEKHPEYYALVDGSRHTDTHGGGPQLCVTNPEVIQIAAESAIEYLNNHPDQKNISVSQADTANYCHCDNCETINQAEETPMGSQLSFVNSVAKLIKEDYPKVKVGTLAYWYTRQVPKTIRPDPNVQVQLCSIECCTLHAIDDPDCKKNRSFCQDMDDWGGICDDIWIWNYNTNFGCYDLPFPNLRVIAPNIRYFLKNNAKGAFMQANGNGLTGEFSDLRNYIISSLLWNPELDGDDVLEEFIQLHYQSSAKPIRKYLAMIHDNAIQLEVHPNCFPSAEEVGLDLEISEKGLSYFNQALELADDDTIRARVEKASICAYKAMILTGEDLEQEKRKKIINHYIGLAEKYNMTHVSEHKLAAEYFAEIKF